MKIKQLTFSFIGTIIRIVIVILMVLFIYKAGEKAYDFGFRIFAEEPMAAAPGRDVEVTITQGKGVMDIADMLQEKGLVRDAQLFYVQEKLSSHKGKIQPGIYTLNTSMSTEDMLKIMSASAPEEGEEGETSESDTAEQAETSEPEIVEQEEIPEPDAGEAAGDEGAVE